MKENNVPQWILNSKTGIEEQNNEVGMIVADFIGAFRKRGFNESEIGMLLTKAFLLPVEEVEKRVDALLSCDENAEPESARKLCIYAVQQGMLFDNNSSDPCDIITLMKAMYGGEFAFEAFLTYPELLRLWKKKSERNSSCFAEEKAQADAILDEIERVYRS